VRRVPKREAKAAYQVMAMEHTLQTRIVELREEATEGEVTQLTGQCPD
jgi:hypothetical protein